MSDTDSESEGDKIRRTRRSVVVKFKFDDTDSNSSDDDSGDVGPSVRSATSTKRSKKLPSTDSGSDDSEPNIRRFQMKKNRSKPYIYDADDSSDTSWSPFDAAAAAAGATVRTRTRSPRPMRASISSQCKAGPSTSPNAMAPEVQSDAAADCSSDSSDDAMEKCPICLHSFREQEIGTPNVCEHNYCAPCIDEWSRNVQTCPIDRKPFTQIRVRASIENGDVIRTIEVHADSAEPKTDMDVTRCEICNLADREDTMLLCDGCDQGYHMDCLIPPLAEIPEGSWYCDNCFCSDTSEEDINQLIEEMEMEVGIPETRLRVRRVDVPRITRTRQSERIRATILSRRQGEDSDAIGGDVAVPGPSRITTTTTTTTTTRRRTTITKPRKTTRRRKRPRRRRRTYVVEYDVDNFDKKFSIKTTKKVIRRRRKTKRKAGSRRGRCSARRSNNQNSDAATSGVISRRALTRSIEANYPKLHLFGNKNALEYFPNDESDDENASDQFESNEHFGSAGGGGGPLVMSSARFSLGINRGLLKRKQIGSIRMPTSTVTSGSAGSTDILSNIMDTMDRWHTMTTPNNVDKIKIGADGKLSIDQKQNDKPDKPSQSPPASTPNNSDILNAPRGGVANDGNIQVQANNTTFQNNNGDGRGNGDSSYNMGGNGINSGNVSSAAGSNLGRQGGSGANDGPLDFSIDPTSEQPRSRIMTRRKSAQAQAQAQAQSLDNFAISNFAPIAETDGIDLSTSAQYNSGPSDTNLTLSHGRVTRRRQSTLAPPPSLDNFPALIGNDMPVNAQRTPARLFLRRKSTLAPPPSFDAFPALSGSDLPAMDENQRGEPSRGRIMTRRKSTLAPPPSIDNFPALSETNLMRVDNNGGAFGSGQPTRVSARRKSTLAPPPSLLDFPALADPTDDQVNYPPISNYSTRKQTTPKKRARKQETPVYQPLQSIPESSGYGYNEFSGGVAPPAPFMPMQNYGTPPMVPSPAPAPMSQSASFVQSSLPYASLPSMVPPPPPPLPQSPRALTIDQTQQQTFSQSTTGATPSKSDSPQKGKRKTSKDHTATELPSISNQPVDESIPTQPVPMDLNHKPTKMTWKAGPMKKKSIFSTSDDEDHDFQYSAESLEVAIQSNDVIQQTCEQQANETEPPESVETMEKDEDLVQLDDDESIHDQTETKSVEQNIDKSDIVDDSDQISAAKKNILDLHDDDWEELNDDKIEDNAPRHEPQLDEDKNEVDEDEEEEEEVEQVVVVARAETPLTPPIKKPETVEEPHEPEPERSYTPCLDEQIHEPNDKPETAELDDAESAHTPEVSAQPPRNEFDNIETELISDEDNELLNEQSIRKDSAKKSKKKKKTSSKDGDNEEEFRKISKSTKERRYREQRGRSKRSGSKSKSPQRSRSRSRSRHRSRSRSWSRNRRFNNRANSRGRRNLNQRFGRIAKRREIQRYNVRNVIFDRQPRHCKDQYGRDEARPNRSPSRSPSPRRRRSTSRNSVRRRVTPLRRSLSGSRSTHRRRRSSIESRGGSFRRSVSPQQRHSIRSPSKKSESPRYAQYSRSPRDGVANGTVRSMSGSPKHRSGKGKSRKLKKKASDKKVSKRRNKRRKTRDGSVSGADSHYDEPARPLRSRSKSWNANARDRSWTRSPTPPTNRQSDIPDESWTPPIGPNENLRVTLANSDKKRRRDKKKRTDKRRTEQRKEKRRQRPEAQHVANSNRPSKEVFASGDNILVSVSFNNKEKEMGTQQQTTIVTLPPSKDQIQTKKQTERNKRGNKDPSRKRKKLNVKPVAIIDLDNSPFKEMTPSPRAVIILSDSDHERDTNKENINQQRGNMVNVDAPSQAINDRIERDDHVVEVVNSPPASPTMEDESFELLSMGPKTPPEPRLIKFALPKAKVRTVVNPLHDANDDQNDTETPEPVASGTQETTQNQQNQQQNKVGPNTPSDTGPYSPDVYDPFEPTKSPSPPPSQMNESALQLEAPRSAESTTNIIDSSKRTDKSLFNSKPTLETDTDATDKENVTEISLLSPPRKDKTNTEDISVQKSSHVHVFSNVLLAPAKENIVRAPAQTQRSLTLFPLPTISPNKPSHSQTTKQSPMKFGPSLLSRLPLPPITKAATKSTRHNGNDDVEGDSPYSPQSSDYDDLFDPPSPAAGNANKKSGGRAAGGFDDLFGTLSPPHKSGKSSGKSSKRHHKKGSIKEWLAINKQSTQMGYGKLNNDQIRILEDIPASAVELQAKDKYLRKLNRQERVVEEVKLILKPHYNRKNITKEEYKDIMRRAVPKICHNPSGEINPKKIKNLIEAYVRKFRYRRKTNAANTK